MIRSSQETVVSMLKTYIKECQSGKREGAAMSCVSTGSLDADEKEAWRGLRKDLQSVGITPDLFQRHRPVILSTIQRHLAPDGGRTALSLYLLLRNARNGQTLLQGYPMKSPIAFLIWNTSNTAGAQL
ncbi:uncharacterized protein N7496_012312 [Penicillium cataractarum]|uniref:Uncharacterized protein n=1 Tax=Penicillium cataractarum TaxID=2100454 RepID=A0A9W9R7J0_9EURO|nr:uncharacterized protein N7496_012312 [Penicillium cataractarum]KAJ5355100.1 hypothetical protein N7496_012312 [Penicillium cataractarum]